MRRRSRHSNSNQTLNVWPAFTDVMSNAFMILSLFLLLAIVKSLALNLTIDRRDTEMQTLESENQRLKDEIASLKSQPPIEIKDAPERKFESGSAVLSPGLRSFIQNTLANQIEDYAQGKKGFIVQVIGHTDGEQYADFLGNLDDELEAVALGSKNIRTLTPGSNADLGLMRALAVVQELKKNPRLRQLGLQFRAYSAAQLYLPSGAYAQINRNPNINRRRIEIRFSPPAETK